MLQRLRTLFGIFFFLSLVTLGGGLAMLPAMREEFVRKRGWGVLRGYRMAGLPGALVSWLGGILPPFLAIVLVAGLVFRLRAYAGVGHAFLGVRAAVSALILYAVVGLGRQVFSGKGGAARGFTWAVAALSFLSLAFLGANAVYVLLAGGVAGWLLHLWLRRHGEGKA